MDTQIAVAGAGPAGLAAALTLSRSMLKTIVFETERPARNAASPFVASLPGMDHRVPSDIRDAVRRDVMSYPYARFENTGIKGIEAIPHGFELFLDDGKRLTAENVLLATGMIDRLPQLKGLQDCWGKSVINCPFCHGIEWKDRAWGIYANREEVLAAAEIYRNWTSDLTYFIDPSITLPDERAQELSAMGISIEHSLPKTIHSRHGLLTQVELPDGRFLDLDCLLIFPFQEQVELVSGLDLSLTSNGYIEIDEGYRTSVPGIYAAGDLTYEGHQNTPTAFHMGNMAAVNIVMDSCFQK